MVNAGKGLEKKKKQKQKKKMEFNPELGSIEK